MRSIAVRFLLPVGVFAVLFSAFVLYHTYSTTQAHVQQMMDRQAELALEFDRAIRHYMGEKTGPIVKEENAFNASVPQAMSGAMAVRSIFASVRRSFPDYLIKLSSDHPRNPADQASPDELKIIQYFNDNPEVKTWAGKIKLEGKEYFARFSASRMEKGCVGCHGRPAVASSRPTGQPGATTGFQRSVGDVIALDTFAIPTEKVESAIVSNLTRESAVIVAGLGLLFGAVLLVFRSVVARRLSVMARHFNEMVHQPESASLVPVKVGGRDEIGVLAASFNALAGRLRVVHASLEQRVAERTAELVKANEELQCEIAERERAEQAVRQSNDDLQRLNDRLMAMTHQLQGVMKNVVDNNDGPKRFDDPSLPRCWEAKNCDYRDCPAYEREDKLRCWEVAGTFCKGKVQGRFAQKLKDCRLCEVYQEARIDSVCELGEAFNDTMAILEDRQQALKEALRAAEAATRAKSEFLVNMSHEIRTPMTAILGFSQMLVEDILCCTECPTYSTCEPRRKCKEHLNTVESNGKYLLQIINDILDLSKIEAGKLEVERIACSPVQLLTEVQSVMQIQADAKSLSFGIEYIGPIPETIQTDPMRLRQILTNLIGNGIKFTETGGVRLVARLLRDETTESTIQFDVIDTGPGMSAEQAAKLFLPFTQADSSTTRKFGGTGLGLTISQRLAKLLGGEIVLVDTQPGRGSHFRLTVGTGALDGVTMIDNPMKAAVVKPECREKAAKAPSAGNLDGRILLAEDGLDNQRLISFFLKKAGAEVTVVENGKLAADAALAAREEGKPFDVILMDMQMPVMDGYEATGQLRRNGYTGRIIALTANAMEGDRQKCLDAGCDDYTTKPIDRKKLIEMVRECLQPAAVPPA